MAEPVETPVATRPDAPKGVQDVLARVTGDIIALSPPLIIEKSQIDELVGTIGTAIKAVA